MKRTILLLLGLSLAAAAYSREKTVETRTASVRVEIDKSDDINIVAKYTDLTVEAWDEEAVLVEATIRFDGKMTDKMQKFLDAFEEEVESNITSDLGELLIKTNLDEPNKFQLGSKYFGITMSFNEDELKLTYNVKVPSSNKLIIKNSYRDVELIGAFQEVDIDQYSGDLDAGQIENATLKLKYGKADFGELGKVSMNLYEQNIDAKNIRELVIDTKYSELKIESIGEMEITSYESDFELGSMDFMEGNLKYGKMEVTERLQRAELTTYEFDIEGKEIGSLTFENSKYGKLEVELLENIKLIQSYEDEFDIENLGTLLSEQTKYADFEIEKLSGDFQLLNAYEGDVVFRTLNEAESITIEGKYVETTLDLDGISYKLNANTKYGKIDIDKTSMNVTKYIKDGSQLEIEARSNPSDTSPLAITIKGYEMKLKFN